MLPKPSCTNDSTSLRSGSPGLYAGISAKTFIKPLKKYNDRPAIRSGREIASSDDYILFFQTMTRGGRQAGTTPYSQFTVSCLYSKFIRLLFILSRMDVLQSLNLTSHSRFSMNFLAIILLRSGTSAADLILLSAELLVFLSNFAIQRDFIFGDDRKAA